MLGGMFAGHTESGGEMIVKNGKKMKLFYGMSSATAMKKHVGGVAEYRYVADVYSKCLDVYSKCLDIYSKCLDVYIRCL